MKLRRKNSGARFLKKFRALALLLIGGTLLYGYWWRLNSPVNQKNSTNQEFMVAQGQSTTAIANRLVEEKLVRSAVAFRLAVELKDLNGKLQAGEFNLNQTMNLNEIIISLTRGANDYWVTFTEGLRVEEYAEILAEKSEIDGNEFILAAKPFEGQLYPDTYLISSTASVDDIVILLRNTFAKKSPVKDKSSIIIASLIEREARHDEDRRLVSSVIHNRLEIGMALQLDATVQYVMGKTGNWWPKNLTLEDLKINSPFNTYLNPGLPPAPIANPGSAALNAAVNPASTDYLYYLSDGAGNNHYAITLEEHRANIAKYLSP